MNVAPAILVQLWAAVAAIGGQPQVLKEDEQYQQIELSPQSRLEIQSYPGDSCLVVFTVCSPICSSLARVYNKKGEVIRVIEPPYPDAVFPLAFIVEGKLVWHDNTEQMLDETEK